MVKMFHIIYTAMQRLCQRLILSTSKVKIIILRHKYTDAEKQQCNMLSDDDDDDDDDDDGFFEV